MTMFKFLLLRRLGAKPRFLLAQFGRQRLAEILRIEDLANFDFGAAVERRALHPFDRLVPRLHLNQPETGDKVAGHGERTMAHAGLFSRIFDPGAFRRRMQPSPASMTPAFTISSLNLPIAVSISVLGITPASLFLSAFTITMNRIVTLRFSIQEAGGEPAPISKTNRVLRHRHVLRNYFGANCWWNCSSGTKRKSSRARLRRPCGRSTCGPRRQRG